MRIIFNCRATRGSGGGHVGAHAGKGRPRASAWSKPIHAHMKRALEVRVQEGFTRRKDRLPSRNRHLGAGADGRRAAWDPRRDPKSCGCIAQSSSSSGIEQRSTKITSSKPGQSPAFGKISGSNGRAGRATSSSSHAEAKQPPSSGVFAPVPPRRFGIERVQRAGTTRTGRGKNRRRCFAKPLPSELAVGVDVLGPESSATAFADRGSTGRAAHDSSAGKRGRSHELGLRRLQLQPGPLKLFGQTDGDADHQAKRAPFAATARCR